MLSWLWLRGRCRACSTRISARYPLVELSTGVLFAVLAARFGTQPALPAFLYLAAVGIALAVIDVDVRRLPDALTLPSYPVAVALLGLAALARPGDGSWPRALAGGAVAFAMYYLLAFIHPAGMGFGDVKLSGLLGLYLAWIGWGVLAVGLFLGFLLGGLFGAALIAVGRGGRKTAVPYGPFMLMGTLVAVLFGQQIVAGYRTLTGL